MARRKTARAKSTPVLTYKRKKTIVRTKSTPKREKKTILNDEKYRKALRKPRKDKSRARKITQNSKIKVNRPTTDKSRQATSTIKQRNTGRQKSLYIKRSSGRQEKFDKHRMTQTISRSGVPFLMARDITNTVVRRINSRQRGTGMYKSSKSPKKLNLEQKKNGKEAIIQGNEIRNMVTEELRNRNRTDIAASYDGQSPNDMRLDNDENIESTAPTVRNVTASRTSIMHDKSKYGGA
jgi:transcriptional repressor NrdR